MLHHYQPTTVCVTGRLSGTVRVRVGDRLCRALVPVVSACDWLYEVYTVRCEIMINASSVLITQETNTSAQMTVCEVAVMTSD